MPRYPTNNKSLMIKLKHNTNLLKTTHIYLFLIWSPMDLERNNHITNQNGCMYIVQTQSFI
jgi:hypothetical protein